MKVEEAVVRKIYINVCLPSVANGVNCSVEF